MMIDPVKIENITKTIVEQKYIANQNLIDIINSLRISDTIDNKIMFDFLYSVGKMYFIANKNTENYLRKALKFTNTDRIKIEINMILGVEHLREKKYRKADEFFMTCYPLQNDIHEILFDCPWKEKETVKLDITDRIDLYQFLIPYFSYIDTDDYFDFLAFQLRSNETVHLIRTGDHQTAHKYFEALFNYLPNLELDVIADIREKFREKRKHDMNIQVFDLATIYHYLGISNWLISDFDKALLYFYDSEAIRKQKSHLLDLQEIYINIGSINNITRNYWEGNEYFKKALDLVYEFGEINEIIGILLNIAQLNQFIFEFDKSLQNSKKALKISNEIKLRAESIKFIASSYQYMGELDKAIEYYELNYELRKKMNDKREINIATYRLITIYNIKKEFTKAKLLLDGMKNDLTESNNINDFAAYEISLTEYEYYTNSNCDITHLFNILTNHSISQKLFEDAILLTINIDLHSNNDTIYTKLTNNNILLHKIQSNRHSVLICYLIYKKLKISKLIDKNLIKYITNELENIPSEPIIRLIKVFIHAINQQKLDEALVLLVNWITEIIKNKQYELLSSLILS